ncbi:DMT family transporter [Sporomusa acidovorans]|uniref:EamA domain-containing protein n=1 Tax=Sporomusa acidovorans (strain ATCC 49682 / DSM 3132 / Mol) TaxID=1123286 RepID=A0ABZ3IX70_SPOA4|nr:DMT family transporter [Sporomusa acidovorans]OZC23336.1 putative inner membrane transporter YedA [Sporomusa acidovorans DSM 3132]SDE42180.1 Permease of the drug/metabolite transporter (DMT) superfamily [Sporomusa acidovorans]
MQLSLRKTYIILLLVPLFWGGAFGTTKHVLTELPPLTASALRFLIAGLLMLLWSVWRRELEWAPIRKNFFSLLALGATGVFLYNYFFATGLQYTSAITGALVIVVNPVFTACIASLFMGEARNLRTAVGVILSLIGVTFVVSKGDFSILSQMSIGVGEQCLFGAVASWVAYTLLIKKVTRTMGAGAVTSVSTILGAGMLLLVSVITEGQWHKTLHLSNQTMLEILYLAIFATVVAFLLFNWGIQRSGATKASAYINLMPVNALWIAVLLYGETISAYHVIGMALTIAGVFITTQSKSQPAKQKPTFLA